MCMCSEAQSCQTVCSLWTVAGQTPLSMEFSRQKYWSGLLFPTPGDLPDPGIEPASLVSLVLVNSLPLHHLGSLKVVDQPLIKLPGKLKHKSNKAISVHSKY